MWTLQVRGPRAGYAGCRPGPPSGAARWGPPGPEVRTLTGKLGITVWGPPGPRGPSDRLGSDKLSFQQVTDTWMGYAQQVPFCLHLSAFAQLDPRRVRQEEEPKARG